jgi:hypothetical protein
LHQTWCGGSIRYVQETILVFVLFVDAAHERGSRRENLVHKDEDSLLGAELDALANNIYELTDGQICGDEILLLVDSSDVRFLDLLADDLNNISLARTLTKQTMDGWTYWDAVGVLLANAFGFCLALLKGMLVLELGTHDDEWRWYWRNVLEF